MSGDYQSVVMERLESLVYQKLTMSTSGMYRNHGLVIVTRKDLSTVATLGYDFQPKRVMMDLDPADGYVSAAPRSDTHFHWVPGNPNDDAEVKRLLDTWARVLSERVDHP
jgi:hypothetical protein